MARVLAPKVTVNAVCPGPIDSRWIREGNPDWDLNEMVADYPIPKASSPDEIADAVVYFATGNRMATGQVLSVDGGQDSLGVASVCPSSVKSNICCPCQSLIH